MALRDAHRPLRDALPDFKRADMAPDAVIADVAARVRENHRQFVRADRKGSEAAAKVSAA